MSNEMPTGFSELMEKPKFHITYYDSSSGARTEICSFDFDTDNMSVTDEMYRQITGEDKDEMVGRLVVNN